MTSQKQDWFRKKTWTEEDQKDFFTKLNRARQSSKCQYLYLQACALAYTVATAEAAIAVAEMGLAVADHEIQKVDIYGVQAVAFANLGKIPETLNAYKSLFEIQKTKGCQGDYHIHFAKFLLRHHLTSHYGEGIDAIVDFGLKDNHDSIMPKLLFEDLYLLAFMYEDQTEYIKTLPDSDPDKQYYAEYVRLSKSFAGKALEILGGNKDRQDSKQMFTVVTPEKGVKERLDKIMAS